MAIDETRREVQEQTVLVLDQDPMLLAIELTLALSNWDDSKHGRVVMTFFYQDGGRFPRLLFEEDLMPAPFVEMIRSMIEIRDDRLDRVVLTLLWPHQVVSRRTLPDIPSELSRFERETLV